MENGPNISALTNNWVPMQMKILSQPNVKFNRAKVIRYPVRTQCPNV